MYYLDIKQVFSINLPANWPDNIQPYSRYNVIEPGVPSPEKISLASLQKSLSQWLGGTSFTDLINALPSELTGVTAQLLDELQINEFAFGTGIDDSQGQGPLITGFNFTFSVSFDTPPSVCGFELVEVGLALNFVNFGDALAWNPILLAGCSFMGVNCGLSIGLLSPALTIVASDTGGINIDNVLQAASGSGTTTLAVLQSNMGINGDLPEIELFQATADLSASPAFSCQLTLATPGWTWKDCSLNGVGIEFRFGDENTSFTFTAQLSIGGLVVDVLIGCGQNDGVTITGAIPSQGIGLAGFIDAMASTLGFTNPLPGLEEIELTGISFSIDDGKDGITFTMGCHGAIAFDAAGTSLQFCFLFVKASGNDVAVTLQLAELVFQLTEKNGTYLFSAAGPGTVSLDDLAHMTQLFSLYGLTSAIDITLTNAVLALAPENSGGHHILCAMEFSLSQVSLNNDILKMILGGDGIGLSTITLLGANQPWTIEELTAIPGLPGSLNTPVPQGVSCITTFAVGDNLVTAPLTPSNTNNPVNDTLPVQNSAPSNPGTWFNVQRQLGPVYLNRIGLQLNNDPANGPVIDVLADASFILGPMTFVINGFALDVPIENAGEPRVGLQGFSLDYSKPPLSICGGFLNQGDKLYIGEVEIQTESIFLSAIGEYASSDGYTSLALFAALTEPPLGGPVFCYVTGLAAGFGYNSALQAPSDAAQVAQFPLIIAASGSVQGNDPLSLIKKCISPQQGENWIAVGLLFKSFELIQSTALLTAAFGQDLQFAVLGQSEISVPPAADTRLAYAQVDVEAQYMPGNGSLAVEGILAPNSYVLSQDCHIQGGFIFILKEGGDFVVSFGGYAPDFNYVSLGYPGVQRLEMLWNIDTHTCIKGSEYFALTPAVMMAGGSLQATWNSGIFSAWFNVNIDMLIQWRPFYYQASFSMSIGISFDLRVAYVNMHFTFEIGAQLAITGPPFHGHAHIDLDVISFDVDFGAPAQPEKALEWFQFRQMLPGDPDLDAVQSDLLAVKVTSGLKKDLSQVNSGRQALGGTDNPKASWVLNGTDFCFNIQSSLPITTASAGQVSVTDKPMEVRIGIPPMEEVSANGILDIAIFGPDGGLVIASPDATANLVATPIVKDMAAAHWGTAKPRTSNDPPVNCTTGYLISGGAPVPDSTSPVDLAVLLASPVSITTISDRNASVNPFSL